MTVSETFIAAINREELLQHVKPDEISLGVTEQGPSISKSERRMFGTIRHLRVLHDALAELLAREERSERVAVASTFSAQGLKIFVAADHNKDLDILTGHLRNVWDALRNVKARNSLSESKIRTPRTEVGLRKLVYEYSWKKHVQRFKQYKVPKISTFFTEVLEKKRDVMAARGEPRAAFILEGELKALQDLRSVCEIMDKYDSGSTPSRDELDVLATSILLLNHRLKQLDDDAFSRWGATYRKTTRTWSRDAFPIFVEKLCSIERAVRELLRLSVATKSSVILDAHLDVVLVAAQPIQLKYDLLDDPNIREVTKQDPSASEIFESTWKSNASDCQEPWKLDQIVYPHCECTLLAYLASIARADADSNDDPYGFIGVSEPSCIGCSLYFSVYSEIADKHGPPMLNITAFRAVPYSPWAMPTIEDTELDMLIDSRLCTRVRRILGETIGEEGKVRRNRDRGFSETFSGDR